MNNAAGRFTAGIALVAVGAMILPADAAASAECRATAPTVTTCEKMFTLSTGQIASSLEPVGAVDHIGQVALKVWTATGSHEWTCTAQPGQVICGGSFKGYFVKGQVATIKLEPIAILGDWLGRASSV